MMNCKQAVRLLSDAMDRDLPAGERLALRLHTLICAGCRHYRQQLSFLRQACQQQVAADDATIPGSPP